MLGSITRQCANRGFDLLISFQKMEDDWHTRYQDSHRADGLILLGYGDYTQYEQRLTGLVAQGTRFVRWGSVRPDNIGATVGSDNFGAGQMAGAHLIAQGRRDIAFLGQADEHYPEFSDRYHGLQAALAQAGLSVNPDLQIGALTTEESGYLAARADCAGRALRCDLCRVGPDRHRRDARALRGGPVSAGRCGADGFDDIPAAGMTNPSLTTMMQDLKSAGILLIETLLAQIEDRPLPSPVLPTRLVRRKSCGGERHRANDAGDLPTEHKVFVYVIAPRARPCKAGRKKQTSTRKGKSCRASPNLAGPGCVMSALAFSASRSALPCKMRI
jgi:DNA-binding LacI/PurR family transcriptional regulator